MVINCFRCGKEIHTPNAFNADYIIASDTIVREPVELLVALRHNPATLNKQDKGVEINDSEYDRVEVPSLAASGSIGSNLVKVVAEIQKKDIQKTGIICPECYKNTDFVIWGIHKGQGVEKLEKK